MDPSTMLSERSMLSKTILSAARFFVASGVLLGALAGVSGCSQSAKTAPLVPFVTITGEKLTSDAFKGKVTLVNFWATSCTTCVKEMPMLAETYTKFAAKGYQTIAVAMSYDPPNYVLNFVETRKLPFKVALDPRGDIAKAWNDTQVTPTSYLVNKRGEIVKRYVGEPDHGEFHTMIEKLLAEG
jgi:peroxiredoxin